ncbi:hypothetical protein Ancab_026064 [Ancistrocladus abbreviatus]
MAVREDDSDAPEEFTTEQAPLSLSTHRFFLFHTGIKQDEEIRKVQRENKATVIREGKERRKKWAERLTPRPQPQPQSSDEVKKHEIETEARRESQINDGMLPEDIVNLLAAREKQVFLSDSDEEEKMEKKTKPKRVRPKKSGVNPIILEDIAPAHCVENSLEFLKKRKLQVRMERSKSAKFDVHFCGWVTRPISIPCAHTLPIPVLNGRSWTKLYLTSRWTWRTGELKHGKLGT